MSTDRKLLIIVACAAVVVAMGFAVFSNKDDGSVLASPPENRATGAQAEVGAGAIPAGAPVPEASSPADYLPLSDGFLLTYLVEVSYKGDQPRFGIAKTSVEGRETIRGAEYYKVLLRVTGISEMRDPVLRYCRKSGDAWHELDGAHKNDPAFEAVTLPLGARAGVAWEKDTPEERSHWRVEGTETVSLLGKQYPHCLRVAYERRLKNQPEDFETGHYFLAPNIGLIQQVASASGTRMSFTLDHRSAESIAFYTTLAGTYEGISDRKMSGGLIQLSADGRYKIRKSRTDLGTETGTFERHPTREDTLIFRGDDAGSTEFGLRSVTASSNQTVFHLKRLSPGESSNVEFVRSARNR